jgi:hypothetical protein
MVRYMKQAMVGTFFERWLAMSGWMASVSHVAEEPDGGKAELPKKRQSESSSERREEKRPKSDAGGGCEQSQKGGATGAASWCVTCGSGSAPRVAVMPPKSQNVEVTSQTELEKLIRAIATNSELTPAQKNTTIQGLRNSVWKRNQRQREQSSEEAGAPTVVNCIGSLDAAFQVHAGVTVRYVLYSFLCWCPSRNSNSSFVLVSTDTGPQSAATTATTRVRRATPPSSYYQRTVDGKMELVWSR